jgi:hypothetical protein
MFTLDCEWLYLLVLGHIRDYKRECKRAVLNRCKELSRLETLLNNLWICAKLMFTPPRHLIPHPVCPGVRAHIAWLCWANVGKWLYGWRWVDNAGPMLWCRSFLWYPTSLAILRWHNVGPTFTKCNKLYFPRTLGSLCWSSVGPTFVVNSEQKVYLRW